MKKLMQIIWDGEIIGFYNIEKAIPKESLIFKQMTYTKLKELEGGGSCYN